MNANNPNDENDDPGNQQSVVDPAELVAIQQKKNRHRLYIACIACIVLVVAIFAVQSLRVASARVQLISRLKQIALGLHNFAGASKDEITLPPAAIYDRDGHPLLSWRVAILPYIEQASLYRQFRLDEPWDSPNNLPLLAKMPKTYEHPLKSVDSNTYYRVFHGVGAAFEGTKGVKLTDFPDGTSNTLFVVEADEAVPWTKPDEFEYDAKLPLPKLGGHWNGTLYAALADGSVRGIKVQGNEANIRRAILRYDGEPLGTDW